MSIITLIVALAIIGLVLYLIETYIPMDPAIKTIIRVIVVLFVILWLLSAFGILSNRALRIGMQHPSNIMMSAAWA